MKPHPVKLLLDGLIIVLLVWILVLDVMQLVEMHRAAPKHGPRPVVKIGTPYLAERVQHPR